MGYVTSSGAGETIGVCDVHLLVDGDRGRRPVQWCSICRAWICDACSHDLRKRGQAMVIRALMGSR